MKYKSYLVPNIMLYDINDYINSFYSIFMKLLSINQHWSITAMEILENR